MSVKKLTKPNTTTFLGSFFFSIIFNDKEGHLGDSNTLYGFLKIPNVLRLEALWAIIKTVKHIIHKYSNRRLYDVTEKKVVTLADLRSLVERGDEIKVLDRKTGKDITEMTLARAVLREQTRKGFFHMPFFLKEIFGGKRGVADFFRSGFSAGWGMFGFLGYKTREFLSKMVQRGHLSKGEGERLIRALEGGEEADPQLKKLIEKVLSEALVELGIPSKGEVDELRERLRELREEIEHLRKRLGMTSGDVDISDRGEESH